MARQVRLAGQCGGVLVSQAVKDIGVLILEHVRAGVSPDCYQTWFGSLCVREFKNGVVHITAPNRFVKQWLESHYRKELLQAAQAVLADARSVELSLACQKASEPAKPVTDVIDGLLPPVPAAASPSQSYSANGIGARRETVRLLPLSPKFRLENFVVGVPNRLAYVAAQSVVESPGEIYNPLFLHGKQGLGKTHLLQGIAHLMLERNPPLSVIYTSCEEFTNAYISAVQFKRLDAFRARFRNCDVLLVDDVQFLAGRERTQEEFLHTFDALRQSRKQIVLSADAAPREIKRLDPKLVTRFQSELVARLEAPDQPLRVRLIQEKARARGFSLEKDVVELFATHIENNVRELEGAVCKLIALAAAYREDSKDSPLAHSDNRQRHLAPQASNETVGSPVAPESSGPASLPPPEGAAMGEGRNNSSSHFYELALVAMRELGYLRSGPVTLSDILEAVCRHYAVRPDDVRSEKRGAQFVQARHVGMYLAKQLTAHSLCDIGRCYGNRNHATVLHGCDKINEFSKRDEKLQHDILALRQVLGR